ncbi:MULTISPECIES: NAD(P)H-dependent oxidoreductase [unclassified Salinibacterium]|uniref:NADPH-dependent FMN reductase n=1 Tax=unclassified Salinibacterium TaxID=2632331 RepID=UPI001420EEE8|nr:MULTISPECIES: NAD(P)H-dependent oxidoreductase [unclassified Salinibacterium]
MVTTVVVGNPKRNSRTRAAAERVAEALSGRHADHVIEVIDLGPALLEWGDAGIAAAVDTVAGSDLVVIASPTYKATYTGLLKTFLDKFAGATGMHGVVAAPVMVGGAWDHALAAELTLKPVLAELGATTALPGLFLLESEFESDGRIDDYGRRWAPVVERLTRAAP